MRLARCGRLCARKAPHFNHPRKALSVTDERSAFVARELSHVLTGAPRWANVLVRPAALPAVWLQLAANGGHSRDDNPRR